MEPDFEKELNELLCHHGVSIAHGAKITAGYVPITITDHREISMVSRGMNGSSIVVDRSGFFINHVK